MQRIQDPVMVKEPFSTEGALGPSLWDPFSPRMGPHQSEAKVAELAKPAFLELFANQSSTGIANL